MNTFDKIKNSKVGDKVCLFAQRRRWNVMAKSERYVILSKPCFGKALYTIFDFEDEWIGPDNLVFGIYDYNKREDAEEALKDLEKGEMEISRRHGISFDYYHSRWGRFGF